jgi:putative transposase
LAQSLLHAWPMAMPRQWPQLLNGPQTEAEEHALRRAVNGGTPFGSDAWQQRTIRRLRLEYTIRPRGQPKKASPESS